MAAKCALIVDDSRTARQVLGDVLAANRLRVETAASAEEALEYLSRHRPDVIFMDHLMPGMDGLQAVRAIKTNPATATIPIMMYTSQEGEVYLGQARALGALGVLPKQIKPVEVADVLRSLHLIGGAEPQSPLLTQPAESPPPERSAMTPGRHDDAAAPNAREQAQLQFQLQELLDEHRRDMRAEVEAIVSRVLREQAAADPPRAAEKEGTLRFLLTGLLVLSLAVLAGLLFRRELDAQESWRSAVEQNASLLAALRSRGAAPLTAGAADQSAEARDASERPLSGLVAALEWGVNQAAVYPPGSEPFGDTRLQLLQGLVERLTALGFTGTIRLDSHVGDFCYVAGADETLALAPDDLPAERCQRIGLPPDEARLVSAGESVRFANFVDSRRGETAVRIELVPHGNVAPVAPYPPDPQGLTAGEWNRIASQNNRVSVALLTDNAAF